jgi:tetratricopeptide (TPR) repeat protein
MAMQRPAAALLLGLLAIATCAFAANAERKFTPREAAELRYADRVVQRAVERTMTGKWTGARADYREAIKSLTIAYGEVHPRIAELYVLLARTRFTEAVTKQKLNAGGLSKASEEFDQAIAIYDALPDPPSDKVLEAYAFYGDVLIVTGKAEQATQMYQRAWDLLVSEASEEVAADYFDRQRRLFSGRLRGDRNDEDQIVWLTFTIGADGQIHDIEDAGSSAGRKAIARVTEFLLDSRFRPPLVNRMPRSVAAYTRLLFPSDGSDPQELVK